MSKKKVLHAAMMRVHASGVINQMSWEQESANKYGLSWDVAIFTNQPSVASSAVAHLHPDLKPDEKGLFNKINNYVSFRKNYYRWLLEKIRDVDVVILRHSTCDPFQILFIRRVNKPVYVVHHTHEISEIFNSGGFFGALRAFVELILNPINNYFSSGFIGVTREIVDLRTFPSSIKEDGLYEYPNGILFDSTKKAELDQYCLDGDKPKFLFVASSFSEWHGLDLLLIEAIHSDKDFELHIVGEVNKEDRITASKDERIFLHGHLKEAQLKELTDRCEIGLSSFALFRNSIKQACTLKTREYLANGLPVYSGHTDVFPPNFCYFRSGKVSINDMIEYRNSFSQVKRAQVRDSSMPYIDKEHFVNDLYRWLNEKQ